MEKTKQTTNAGKEGAGSLCSVGGNVNQFSTMEINIGAPQKTENITTI
jgi:hypothetical protein